MIDFQYWNRIYRNILALAVHHRHRFMIIKPFGVKFKEKISAYLAYFELQVVGQMPIPRWHSLALFLYLKTELNPDEWQKRLFINRSFEQMEQDDASLILLSDQLSFQKLAQAKSEIRQFTGSEKTDRVLADGQKIVLTMNAVHTPDEERLEYELKVLHYFLPQLETTRSTSVSN